MAQKLTSLVAAGMTNNSDQPYIKYDNPAVEPPVENEDEKVESIIRIINSVQEKNFALHRHGFRATHVKTQAIVKGELEILPNLPPELAQGLASPENAQKTHPIAIRYANEPSFLQDDKEPGPRGCGMKVFDVQGTFMIPIGTETKTQDLTFNNAPMLELGDVDRCLDVFTVREKYFYEPDKLRSAMKWRTDALIQMAPSMLPNYHFLAYPMYSQSAYRWGDYVVKYGMFPAPEYQQELAKTHVIDKDSDREQHSKWLKTFFQEHDAEYDFKVQLLQSPYNQSVEDTTVMWDETAFPFQTVGKVRIPKGQDCFSSERRTFWEDKMKLNVWYGLETMRPLGSINRLRKELYKASFDWRSKKNQTEVIPISSVDQIP